MTNVPINLEMLRIQTVPAVIAANFGDLDAILRAEMQNKVTVVTPETLQDEKKLLAELRKFDKELDTLAKQAIEKVSPDINLFKDNVKKLRSLVQDVIDDKAGQLKTLETEVKEEIKRLLLDELRNQWNLLGVLGEFRRATIEDLVKLTSRTAKGNLTKVAIGQLMALAQTDLSLQTKIDARLVSVENECLKAGINPPFSRANVDAFLYTDNFVERLAALIKAETERQAMAEQAMREKLAKGAEKPQAQAEVIQQSVEQQETPKPEPKIQIQEGSVMYATTVYYRATWSYQFTSRPGTDKEMIKAHFRKRAIADGIAEGDILEIRVEEHATV